MRSWGVSAGDQPREDAAVVAGIGDAVPLETPREHTWTSHELVEAHAAFVTVRAGVGRARCTDASALYVRAAVAARGAMGEVARHIEHGIAVIDSNRVRRGLRAVVGG